MLVTLKRPSTVLKPRAVSVLVMSGMETSMAKYMSSGEEYWRKGKTTSAVEANMTTAA
jgi:hypothetical protein